MVEWPPMPLRPRRVMLLLLLGGVVLGAAWSVPSWARGTALVARVAGLKDGWAGRVAYWGAQVFTEDEVRVPSREGLLRGRLLRPEHPRGHTVLLIPGVHAEGIDEPRLKALAAQLAMSGLTVLTLELPDLLRYEFTPREPDMIEDAVLWASSRPELAPDGRVGLMGISFSGGLSVVAAGRPSLAHRLAFTLSLGGHGDLSRVLAFLCTGLQSDGQPRRPHDYGVVILLLNVASRLVPPEQVAPLREGILTFLRASSLTLHDAHLAEETFERARTLQATLPEPAASLLRAVNERDVAALGARLLPEVRAFAAEPSLSPERSPPPPTPVYLLHGSEDTVVPALESVLLAQALAPHTRVHLLLTPLITHAEFDRRADLLDVGRLIAFWAGLPET